MAIGHIHADFDSWSAEGHAARTEYAAAVLEEICADAAEGVDRIRHSGVEVGGVLFGEMAGDVTRILAYAALDCEHAFGPRFVLSGRDRADLKDLLYAARTDPELRAMEPVGWYHSHTRSAIELSPRDMEIYDAFFPLRRQVALVVRPEPGRPARAGFFFRERDGSVRTDSSHEEFPVIPRRQRRDREEKQRIEAPEFPEPAEPAEPAEVAAQPEPTPEPGEPAEAPGVEVEMAVQTGEDEDTPEAAPVSPLPADVSPVRTAMWQPESAAAIPDAEPFSSPALDPDLPRFAAAEIELPSFAQAEPPPPFFRKWMWLLVAAAFVCAAAIGVERYYRMAAQPEPLSLWVADMGGQLLIEWDRGAKPVRDARGGTLEIYDGGERVAIEIEPERLREGSVDYVRRSDIVDVRLRVNQLGKPVEESIRFVGQPVNRPSTDQAARERDELKAEVEKLRQLVDQKDAQIRRLRAPGKPSPSAPASGQTK